MYFSLPPLSHSHSHSLSLFFFSPFIWILVGTLQRFCLALLHCVFAYISCKIVVHSRGNVFVCVWLALKFTCVSGAKITLSVSWGFGWFPSLNECHQGQQSPYYVSGEEPGQMGTAWKLPVILLTVPARTSCTACKNVGSDNWALHTQLAVCWRARDSRKEPACSRKWQLLPYPTVNIYVQISQSMLQQRIVFARIIYILCL